MNKLERVYAKYKLAVETLRRQDPAKGFVDRESLENSPLIQRLT